MKIKRASPQYWTFQGDQDIRDVFQGILCGKIAMNDKKFESVRDDFFFHQFQSNDLFGKFPPLPEIPHIDTPDYISGTDFYIRSKRMPHQYWHLTEEVDVQLSENERTRFRIEYAEDSDGRETLLVNDDDVVISAFDLGALVPLGVCYGGRLMCQETQTSFKFGTLLHGSFEIDEGRYPMVVQNQVNELFKEEWELV